MVDLLLRMFYLDTTFKKIVKKYVVFMKQKIVKKQKNYRKCQEFDIIGIENINQHQYSNKVGSFITKKYSLHPKEIKDIALDRDNHVVNIVKLF